MVRQRKRDTVFEVDEIFGAIFRAGGPEPFNIKPKDNETPIKWMHGKTLVKLIPIS